jgi:carbamoyltransferase
MAMNILGISAYYHDSAACLVQDGRIVAAAQEERFTRKKHDDNFPKEAIAYCLREGGITIDQVDYIAFYEKPFLKFERILETYLTHAPLGLNSFLKAMPVWLKKKLWMKEDIRQNTGFKGKIIFPEHHESHAASAFFPSPFSRAAFLTLDGVGELTTSSFGVGEGNEIRITAEMDFPHSLGMLYSAFTYYTGFKVNSGEYKVMGLAPYGGPKYVDLILKELIDLKEDGSFHMNMDYFNYTRGLTMTNGKFDRLFGGPRRLPESPLTQKEMDLARSIQEVTDIIVLKMAKHIQRETGEKNLVMAGGVALNCVANGKLLRSKIFENIWIQPASGDAGGALGAALFTWYQVLENERKADGIHDSMRGAYLGPAFTNAEIENFLKVRNIPYKKVEHRDVAPEVAWLINDQKVIGWFQGRMEFGPRALGGRSIIGDARSSKMQDEMNLKIKFRESFRPFAPSILKEKVNEYFDLDRESPYMLIIADIQESQKKSVEENKKKLFGIDLLNVVRSTIPAVTHVDSSARIQTVDRTTNPLYHELLTELDQKYGCPLVINTSFNVRGEPIVCTPEDAFRCFMRTNIDYLILGDFILDKKVQKPLAGDEDWKKEFALD